MQQNFKTNLDELFLSEHESHGDPQNGSWFVQKLCDVFEEHGRTDHLEDLLKMTSLELAQLNDDVLGNFYAGKIFKAISLTFLLTNR